jgi:hypothetical protein
LQAVIEEGGIYQRKDRGSQLILKACGVLVDRFVFALGARNERIKQKQKYSDLSARSGSELKLKTE